MVESSGPEADQAGPLPLDHPFVKAVSRLDLESIAEMLTADPRLVDADLHGRAWIGGPRRTAAGWERAPEQTSRAVHLAAYGHGDLLRLLIEHGAEVDALGYEGNHGWAPPLVLACWEGTIETVRLLLEAGADPNLPSRPGGSALHAAINHYDTEKIELLLAHGARHDLYSAAAVGDLEEVRRQLAAGDGLLDRRDDLRGRTPLEWAVFNGREKVAEHLLEAGAEASPQVLVGLGRVDRVRQLAAADPGFVDRPLPPEREPPLMHALRSRDLEMVKLLLSLGADANAGGWEPAPTASPTAATGCRSPPGADSRPCPGRGPRLRGGSHRRRRRRQRRVHPRPLAPLPLPAERSVRRGPAPPEPAAPTPTAWGRAAAAPRPCSPSSPPTASRRGNSPATGSTSRPCSCSSTTAPASTPCPRRA